MASEHPTGTSEGAELGLFLRARRTRTSPQQAGLAVGPGLRRTPGLRREELATLAGISIDYCVRLEPGKETRPSPSVLDALARALQMDDQEHQHLRELAARAARYAPEPPLAPSRIVRPHLKLLLESLRPNPAYAISRSMDMLAWNPGGLALYAGLEDWPAKHRNLARYLFLHPAARKLFPFAGLWERYEVTGRKPMQKTFAHPRVGTVTLTSQSMQLEGTPNQRIGVYTAEPGTSDHDALLLLDMTAVQTTPTPSGRKH
ncbi:helix-turn-helix transcriptional regulator [Streptomyces sp. NPDC060031]|uniref:helix-turn-helix transcriptional regulator n=1 Tax=Streptomyces sp. NPDC060031 TaxID=3347043 RepID=UPI0036CF304F